MTYCLGMLLDAGLIMIADTRTNAGVDDISSYRKLHCLADTRRPLHLRRLGRQSLDHPDRDQPAARGRARAARTRR